VCPACQTVHYENPRIVVGCVPEHEGRILLCRRAIEPRRGYWTIPAGFMENGETLEAGAARECFEEALAEVQIGSLLALVNIPEAEQVHVFFRARLTKSAFGAGEESLEAMLVDEADIPWSEIAFPSTRYALQQYLSDRAAGVENHHVTALPRRLPG
jgi:ADP-ribose pyrophosphatase YjhB (NUDIX family)